MTTQKTTQTSLLLNALKTMLANPAFRAGNDKALKEQMTQVDTLLAGLLARNVDLPALSAEVHADYLRLLPALQQACGGNNAAEAALTRLQAALDASPPHAETIFGAAAGALTFVQALAPAQGRELCKQMLNIERDFSRKFNAALRAAKQVDDAASASASAAHVKAYDEEALRRFIIAQYPREKDIRITKSSFLSGGHSKYTMGIELGGNRELPASLVLRADAGGAFGGSSVVEEYRLLTILHQHGAQVARPIAIEPTGEVFGSPFMLVERRPGRSIGHMFILPPPNLITSRDLATQLAKIHGIPVDAFGSSTMGANTTTRELVLDWIEQSYASWKALNTPGALLESSFHWLRNNVDRYEGRRTLVHGDFGLNNMLIDNERVSCVLDWEFTHIANPAYDLGYVRFQAEALGPWDEFLTAYAAAGGVVPDPMQLDYANLLAETRLTVMTRQFEAAYYGGAPLGAPGAINAAAGYRNTSDERIADILNRVM